MKCLRQTFLFLLLLVFPLRAAADDWNKYLGATDRFYSLDKQEFTSISCTIEVPVTKNQVKQLHAQFEPLKDKLEMRESLADFSLKYSKNEGLTIHYPSFDIKIISEEGMADPAKVKKGIETIKAGFKQQIEGAVMQLQGLFEGLETPKKSQYKITAIKDDKAVYTATYEKDNSTFTETYSHDQRKVQQVSRNGEEKTSSVESYKNISNNKLLLTGVRAVINNAMGTMEIDMTISYEKVKDILFPTRLESLFKQSMQTIKQEGRIDISLKNCTMR
jgi:hypothetical protein